MEVIARMECFDLQEKKKMICEKWFLIFITKFLSWEFTNKHLKNILKKQK